MREVTTARALAPARLACGAVALLAIACGPAAPPPLPPPTVVVTAAAPEPPSPVTVVTAAPVAAEPRPFVPAAPFSIVAEAPGEEDFGLFPLEDGAAILATAVEGNRALTLRLSLIDHDAIEPAPWLSSGMPMAVVLDRDLPIVAGHWPDAVWMARASPCEVYQWQPPQGPPGPQQPRLGRWEPRPAHTPPDGKCTHLAAWTPGAALASIQGPRGPSLVAFGLAPRALPALPPRGPKQAKTCGALVDTVHALFAFPTGEALAFGRECGTSRTWLTRWASRAARGEAVDAEVDLDAPFDVPLRTATEVVVDGTSSRFPGEWAPLEIRFTLVKGRPHPESIEKREIRPFERWARNGYDAYGCTVAAPADGFRYEGYMLTPTGDVFVVGHLMRAGQQVTALLLRNRPVKQALVLP